MNVKILALGLFGILAVPVLLPTPNSYADQAQDSEIKSRLLNRAGTYSEDRRVDEHDLGSIFGPGPKTGCHGDTINAGVTITGVNVSSSGSSNWTVEVTYSGGYTRQGWMTPCIQSPPPNGHEDRKLSGKVLVSIKQEFLKPPTVTMGALQDFGEVADPNHDSNKAAAAAVRNAVIGAF